MPTTRRAASETTKFVSLKKKSRSRKTRDLVVNSLKIVNFNKRKQNKSETVIHASPPLKSKQSKLVHEDHEDHEDESENLSSQNDMDYGDNIV